MHFVEKMILIALVLTSALCHAENPATGATWRTLSRPMKTAYVHGLIDGGTVGQIFVSSGIEGCDSDCNKKIAAAYMNTVNKLVIGVSPMQVVDGMDVFFNDFRNRSLLLTDAYYVTLESISGMPPERVEKILQPLRAMPK